MSKQQSAAEFHSSQPLSSKPAAKDDPSSRIWYFTFNLRARERDVVSQLRGFESTRYRRDYLKDASILSFSASADGSPDIRGFISGANEKRQQFISRWLTHSSNPNISDLQLTRINGLFKSKLIAEFLDESALPAEGGSVQGSREGCRIRVDTLNASGAPPGKPGRKRKGGAGSAVPCGHPQPLQNVSVSTPAPALPSPPAAGQGCSMGGAAPQPAYGPWLLPAPPPHLASGWPPPAGRALPSACGPPPPPALQQLANGWLPAAAGCWLPHAPAAQLEPPTPGPPQQGGNPPSLHLIPPPRAPEAAAGGAPAVAPSPAPVSVAAAAATSPPGPTPTAGTPTAGSDSAGCPGPGDACGASASRPSPLAGGGGGMQLPPPRPPVGPGGAPAPPPSPPPPPAQPPAAAVAGGAACSGGAGADPSVAAPRRGDDETGARVPCWPVGSQMAHFPYGKPPQYFYPQWGSGIGQVRQSESPAGHEVCSGCRQRKIRKLVSVPAAAVQTRLVEMEERCAMLTSELSKET